MKGVAHAPKARRTAAEQMALGEAEIEEPF